MYTRKQWPREPATVWQNDPINPSANRAGKAVIFIRPRGAFGLGHVGWAYLDEREHVPQDETGDVIVAQDKWWVGSVDNPHHTPISPAAEQGYWQVEYTGEPLPFMRSRRYEDYKVVAVPQARTDQAMQEADQVRQHPYELVGANCEDAVYKVLTAYGADLPKPRDVRDWEPNRWFRRIPALSFPIDDDTGLHSDAVVESQMLGQHDLRVSGVLLLAAFVLAGAIWTGLRWRRRH